MSNFEFAIRCSEVVSEAIAARRGKKYGREGGVSFIVFMISSKTQD
jgi:hypothetical protein